MEISTRLLEIAIKDIESVKVLYKNKHYNLALFQLQQAVEKLVKSFGIKANVIKSEEIAKKINHLPHKVFTKLYQSQIEELTKSSKTPILVPDMIPPHQRGKSKTKEKLENLKKLHAKVESSALLKSKAVHLEDIKKFINEAKTISKSPTFNTRKIHSEIKDDFIKTNIHFINFFNGDENVKKISEHMIANSTEIAKNKVDQYKLNRKREAKFTYISFVWINLSLLTSEHEQTTRYPSIRNDKALNDIYDEKNLIIMHIPEFLKMLVKTIKYYKEIYGP